MGNQMFGSSGGTSDDSLPKPSEQARHMIALIKREIHIVRLVAVLEDYHENYSG